MTRSLAVAAALLLLIAAPARAADNTTGSFAGGQLTVAMSGSAQFADVTCSGLDTKVNNNPVTPATACTAIQTIVVNGTANPDSIDLSHVTTADFPNITGTTVNAGDGSDAITGSPYPDNIQAGPSTPVPGGIQNVTPGAGNDTINAVDRTQVILRLTGSGTTLTNSDYNDSGEGHDTITGASLFRLDATDAGVTLDASAVTLPVTVNGGTGADHITTGSGADSMSGQPGDDTLDGGPGTDTMSTIAGAGDVTVGATSITSAHGTDTFTSIEKLAITGNLAANHYDWTAYPGQVQLFLEQGGNDVVRGGPGNDDITLSGGSDDVDGGGGDDGIAIGPGDNDTIKGGEGTDLLVITAQQLAGTTRFAGSTLTEPATTTTLDSIERLSLSGSRRRRPLRPPPVPRQDDDRRGRRRRRPADRREHRHPQRRQRERLPERRRRGRHHQRPGRRGLDRPRPARHERRVGPGHRRRRRSLPARGRGPAGPR